MEHNNSNNSNTSEFKEKLVHLGKVTKVVKGGRNFRWSALIVVGDENGRVGVGLGKAAEVTEAVRKGTEDAPFTGEGLDAEARQNTFTNMMEIALEIA